MRNVVLTAVALSLVLTACGGGNGNGTEPPTSVFSSLSIAPTNPSLVIGDDIQMTATPRDQNGAPMTVSGTPTFERVPGTGTAVTVSLSGRVVAEQQGSAQIRASLTSGGTTHTATTTANVGPLSTTANVTASGTGSTFSPDSVRIAVNGSVNWSFPGPETHNVTFGANEPPGGDIANRSSGSDSRTFPTAGRFDYQCTRHGGMNGVVLVQAP
jgi:plastocyanin